MSREEIDSIVNRNLSAPKQCPSSFQPDSLLKAVQENDSFVVKCIVQVGLIRRSDSSFSSVYEYIKKNTNLYPFNCFFPLFTTHYLAMLYYSGASRD